MSPTNRRSQANVPLRFASSLGMKMLLVASTLLVLSFVLCSGALMILTRRMLQENMESMVSRDSHFLSAVSQGLMMTPGPGSKSAICAPR